MKVVYTLRHRHHHPRVEVEAGALQEPFEHPGRAEMIRAALAADDGFELVAPDDWGTGPIEAVHHPGLVEFLETAWDLYQVEHGPTHDVVPDVFAMPGLREGMGVGREPAAIGARLGWWCYETTTPLTQGTYDAARASVDVALTAAAAVVAGDPVAYGLCRPPGHHASRSLYGGYCFFNNAAVVANHLATSLAAKIAVLDVDYHHGNGTQSIFYDRNDVLTISLHADPSDEYPYFLGYADERGEGRGHGFNVNYPLAAGTKWPRYAEALQEAMSNIRGFSPDGIVVALGLDTFTADPTTRFGLETEDYRKMGETISSIGRPVLTVLEGGYAVDSIGRNALEFLKGIESR